LRNCTRRREAKGDAGKSKGLGRGAGDLKVAAHPVK